MNSSVFVADARGNTSGPTGRREDRRHSRKGQTGRTRRRSAETHRSILATGRAARRMDARVQAHLLLVARLSRTTASGRVVCSRARWQRSTANTSALCRESRSRTAAGGGADASSTRSSPSMPHFDAGVLSRLQCFSGAHSRALQPGAPVFSGPDWGGGFASAPSAAVPALFFKGLARTVGALPLPLPSASRATVRTD